jgi:hypothetical protein
MSTRAAKRLSGCDRDRRALAPPETAFTRRMKVAENKLQYPSSWYPSQTLVSTRAKNKKLTEQSGDARSHNEVEPYVYAGKHGLCCQ